MTMESNLDLLQNNVEKHREAAAVPQTTVQNDNSVFIGEALNDDEKLNLLMTDTKPYITILVGFEEYGKTSFVATCYHIMLTDGGIGEYKFCDSDTLVGLERRSFMRRFNAAMESVPPSTKRTIRGEAHLLTFHLSKDGNEKITIFSDHSGEDYRKYANHKDEIKNDVLIQNADRILFFVDIPSLLDTKFLRMVQDYKNLLSNMKSADIFRPQTKITLLFNKIDIINDDATKERYEEKKKVLTPIFRSIIGINEIETIELTSNNIDKSDDLKSLLQDIAQSNSIQTWIDNNESDLDWVKKFIKEQ